jgi:hypothetical protein
MTHDFEVNAAWLTASMIACTAGRVHHGFDDRWQSHLGPAMR